MIKQIKRELQDIKNHQEHMAYVPLETANPEYNFNEIINLTTRTNAGFKVIGDSRQFKIQAKSNNIIIGISLLILLSIPTGLLIKNISDPKYWIIEFALLGLILLFMRYAPTTNEIEIDNDSKSIKIGSNNFIGKYIIPVINIQFNDFSGFTHLAKSTKGNTITNHFHRISICYDANKSKSFIDLPNGPFYYVNHKVFTTCLTRLIKNGIG